MVTISNDVRLLIAASSSSVKTFRDLTENNNKDSNSNKDTGAY